MTQIVILNCPWWGHDDELNYGSMTLTHPDKVDKRVARRIVRKWYKTAIGRSIPKAMIERIWKRRHVTRPLSEEELNNAFTEMAIASAQELTNPDYQDDDTTGTA